MKTNELEAQTVKKYLTLADEQLIIATREHFMTTIPTITANVLLSGLLIASIVFLGVTVGVSYIVVISLVLIILVLGLLSSVIVVIGWYGHFYVITNRKVLEVISSPLSSHTVNDVFLDQVRATEIDVRIGGFVDEVCNMGDVRVVFDRPSHDEVFVLKNIKNPQDVGETLGNSLKTLMHDLPIWFPPRGNVHQTDISLQKGVRYIWS